MRSATFLYKAKTLLYKSSVVGLNGCWFCLELCIQKNIQDVELLQAQATEQDELIPAAEEVDALLHFKALLSPQSQALLRSWNAGNNRSVCESWVGVNCSTAGHHKIYSITLTGLGLSGTVAPEIGNLTAISVLDLSNNSLTGSIPERLSDCASLTLLNLSFNSFSAAIPSSLSSLSSLQILYLTNNRLSGHIPHALLTNCTSLFHLRLSHNSLTGSIPNQIVSPLRWLILHENKLTGTIPPVLGNCTSLIYLLLYSNQLTGPIPFELSSLHSLQHLAVSANNLTGTIPRSLGNCSNLMVLFLNNNQLTGPVPIELGLLLHLQKLVVSKNHLAGAIPQSLGNCSQLSILQLFSNQLNGSIPTELTRLGLLQIFDLSSNHLSGFLTLSFSNFSSSIWLSLSSNQLTGPLATRLGQLQGLQRLDLGSNSFSDVIPWPSLSNCSSLYQLYLSGNHLHGPGFPSDVGKLQALRELDLQGNLLEGALPDVLQDMSLTALDLSWNRLNGSLPSSLAHVLGDTQKLLMSHNDFSGSLPSWLGRFMMMEEMDLSYNHFTGAIPESLGECVALTILNLSHNHLSGNIPQHLSNLTYLESLDVSSNNLTGLLPAFLGNFIFLQFLNVSFNHFNGTIPLLGVLQSLNASSFQGNPELCGPIIHKACIQSSKIQHHHSAGQLNWKKILLDIALASSMLGVAFILAVCHYLKGIRKFRGRTCEINWLQSEVKRYTAEELTEGTQSYSEGNLLGQGALAEVYKGVLLDGKIVAVKKFKEVCFRETLLQEVKILSKLRHRNLVRVLGCVLNLDINALVLEYMSNGSLEQYLHPAQNTNDCHEFSWRVLLNITTGVANALAYLHHEFGVPIIHGDVKPGNILLDSGLEAHLADFGLAKLGHDGIFSVSSSFKGSIGYMAPEYAYAAGITTKVDVYSFGVVVLEMLTGRRPTQLPESVNLHEWVKVKLLDGVGLEEVLRHANCQAPSLLGITSDHNQVMQLLKLGVACTQDQPNMRPTMQEVVALLHNITMGDSLPTGTGSTSAHLSQTTEAPNIVPKT